MYRGYVKLWRKILDSGWLKNHKLWAFWSWCLVKATHKEYDLIVGCQRVHLMPGDLVFGLNKASEELEISVQSLRTILDLLKVSENLTIKTTNKFSVISIVNWNIYQSEENEINTQINTPLTNEQQTTNNKQTQETQKNENKREYTPEFLSFYEAYPKHKKRDDAFKAWNSQNGKRPSIDVILMAVEKQKKSPDWIKNNGQFIPYPASWLRAGCWADEVSFEEINKQNKREGVRI